jgi:hypothetical protein
LRRACVGARHAAGVGREAHLPLARALGRARRKAGLHSIPVEVAPVIHARRPPIPAHKPLQTFTCASPTAQQKARAFVDPALRDVASGKTELAKNAKGTAVERMQETLQTAGYTLPRFGADGSSVTSRSRR